MPHPSFILHPDRRSVPVLFSSCRISDANTRILVVKQQQMADMISGCQIPIFSVFRLFALHLAPTASALQLLKFGIHSLQLFECVPAPTLSVTTSILTTSSRPSNLLKNVLFLSLRFGFCWPLCAFTNYIYLLTYLHQQCRYGLIQE